MPSRASWHAGRIYLSLSDGQTAAGLARLTADQFTETVQARSSDQAVADWFVENAARHSQAEVEAWNEMMLTRGPDTEEKWQYFKSIRDAVDSRRTDITSWVDLLDLEERRPVPIQDAVNR